MERTASLDNVFTGKVVEENIEGNSAVKNVLLYSEQQGILTIL